MISINKAEHKLFQALAPAGITATADDNARDVAERHERSPIDLLTIMLAAE